MRVLMGIIKNRHGTYYAQRKVPERLQEAVALVRNAGKPRLVFLKKSLDTKSASQANIRAIPVFLEFNRVLDEAEKLVAAVPVRHTLTHHEITMIADYVYASELSDHEKWRVGGRELLREGYEWLLRNADHDVGPSAFDIDALPEHGVSPDQLDRYKEEVAEALKDHKAALALADTSAVKDQVEFALSTFRINLAANSPSRPALGMAALQSYVKALLAIEKRNAGEPIDVPPLPMPGGAVCTGATGGTLGEALEGWQGERERPPGTVREYARAVALFTQLHGNLPVASINRGHARTFRQALQLVPRRRKGALLNATLDELQEYGRKHPHEPKISVGTVNKNFGAVQTVAVWGFDKGLVPDDVSWADPFANMRLEEEDSERTAFEFAELNLLFASRVFTEHDFPLGGRGQAAYWLPLLGLFTGARQGELAALKPKNVQSLDRGLTLLHFVRERVSLKRLKTKASERVVPVHAELVRLGFLSFVDSIRGQHGEEAWLFPEVAPNGRGQAAWSKWFGRYLRALGITDTAKVFHSFRHNMKDALRRGHVDGELREALIGHANDATVSGGYGAKEMINRFGSKALKKAITQLDYDGLKLSRVRPYRASSSSKRTNVYKVQRKK